MASDTEKSFKKLLAELEKARYENKKYAESWSEIGQKIEDSMNPVVDIEKKIVKIQELRSVQLTKIAEIQKKIADGTATAQDLKKLDILQKQVEKTKQIEDGLNKQKMMYKLIYDSFKKLIELGDKYDELLSSNAQKQGIGKKQSEAQVALLQKSVAINNDVNKAFSTYAVTLKEAVETVQAMNEDLGVMAGEYMPQLAIRASELAASTGLTAAESTKFFATLGEIGNTSFQTQQNMAGVADAAAKAAGVPLGKVIKDVSGASANVRTIFRGNTTELIKQAAELRKIGSSLEQAAKSAESLLNFESSVGAELKASALLGKNINFNQSRRLFFEGKIADAEKALQSELERVGDIDKLNYFQRKALSELTGKDINELQRISSLKKTQQKIDQENPKFAADRLKLEKELTKISGSKLEQEKRANELAALENVSKERTKILDAAKEQASLALGKALYPIVSLLRDIQIGILQVITKVASFADGWVGAGIVIGIAITGIIVTWKLLTLAFSAGLKKISTGLGQLGGAVGGAIGKAIEGVGKSIAGLGSSLNAFKLDPYTMASLAVLTLTLIGLGYAFKLVGEGVGAAAPGLKVLGDMFVSLATILADTFLKTLDKLPMLLDNVTANIVKLASAGPTLIGAAVGIGSLGLALAGLTTTLFLFPTSELTKITTQLVAMGAAASGVALAVASLKELSGVELPKIDIGTIAALKTTSESKNQEMKAGLEMVAQKIDVLTSMMAAGKIAVYMDRVKVSKELAEGTLKFGVSGQATNAV